jgi:hypothetical protein
LPPVWAWSGLSLVDRPPPAAWIKNVITRRG